MSTPTSWEGLQTGVEFMMLETYKIDLPKLRHYAWASGDYNTIHFDDASAKRMGLPKPIAHGMFQLGLMNAAVEELLDQIFENTKIHCRVKSLETRFVGMTQLDDALSISAKFANTSEHSFTLQLFIYRNGERTQLSCMGSAIIEEITSDQPTQA